MEDTEIHKITEILGNMAADVKEKEKSSVRKLRAEAEEYLSRSAPNVGPSVPDGLLKFILKSFEEELMKDAKKRVMYPKVKWGPSLREQFGQARKEASFRENLEHIRELYGQKGSNPKLTTRQMRVMAFVRTDRMLTDKLRAEAENDEQMIANGYWVASVAALLAADIGKNRSLYMAAKRSRLWIQSNGRRDMLMRKVNLGKSGGA